MIKFLTDTRCFSRSHLSAPAFHPLAVANSGAKVPFLFIASPSWQLSFPCHIPFPATFTFKALWLFLPYLSSVIRCHKVIFCPGLAWNAISISHRPHFQTKFFSTFSFLPLMLNMPGLFIYLLHSLSKLFIVTSEGSLGWVCWDCACDPCIVCQSIPVHHHIWRLCTLKEHFKMSPVIKDSSS